MAIFSISSAVTGASRFFLRKALVYSARWEVSQIGLPRQSRPITLTTISANSGITGSQSAGTFKGLCFAPSASISITSQREASFCSFPASMEHIFPEASSISATATNPWFSSIWGSLSSSSLPILGSIGSKAIWVVVEMITFLPKTCSSSFRR